MTHLGIVVGVDGSASSTSAVRWAAREAQSRKLPLLLIKLVVPVGPIGSPWPGVPIPEDYVSLQQSEARVIVDAALQVAAESVAGQSLRASGEVVSGPILATLVEMSKQSEMMVVAAGEKVRFRARCWVRSVPVWCTTHTARSR